MISNLTLRQRRQKDNLFEVLKTFSSSQTNLFSFNTNFSWRLTVTSSIFCKLQIQTINLASVCSRKLHAISTQFRLANVWQWIYLINWLAWQNGLLGGIQSSFNLEYSKQNCNCLLIIPEIGTQVKLNFQI